METAVVLLNYNGLLFLKKFIPIIIQYTANQADIVVADNASTDESLQFLSNNFPEIKIIKLPKNLGFAEGYNQALKTLNHKYFVLLNTDVEVTENWLNPIINILKSDNSIAACQPKIKNYNDKDKFEYAGAAGGFLDFLGYPFCRGRLFDSLESDKNQYDDAIEVFWASGACLFIKAQAFFDVSGFDPDFFAHMEEIDLCWRLQLANYKVFYSGQSTVYHIGGGTLPKSDPKKIYLNFRNGLAMLYKNLPENKLYNTMLLRLLLDGLAGIQFFAKGKFQDCMAIIKAHFNFYGNFKLWKSKRKFLLNNFKNNQLPNTTFQESIIVNYFVKGKKKFNEL